MPKAPVSVCAYLCATLLLSTIGSIFGQHQPNEQQQFFRKPWPTYSLQNMPQTRFTCHDKILGGYYADAETQCQMFHVCVKVAGVGVQDFRFLCPNGTAFDQEAQICADWGDVDCEQTVLYYGSDNFDLYRIGSGFESKRAPLAEEEEATYHLQRAESADVRRSKETRVDQKSRPEQPPNYFRNFEATARNSYNNNNNNNYNNYANSNANTRNQQQQQQTKKNADVTKKPIVSYYTPTSTTTTTTTTTTTERYNDESKQELDDIFKGSHSSHFFSNRNGGHEDDFVDHPPAAAKPKPNDFEDYSNKKLETSTAGKTRVATTRARRIHHTSAATTKVPATISNTEAAISRAPTKKVTQQISYNSNYFGFPQTHSSTTLGTTTTTTTTTSRPHYQHTNRFNIAAINHQTQDYIQPTTYNPGHSFLRFQSTTPKYSQQSYNALDESTSTTHAKKPTISSRKSQKLERLDKTLGPRNSTFVNQNEFAAFTPIKTLQPQPFQVQRGGAPARDLSQSRGTAGNQHSEPQYQRTRARTGKEDPTSFNDTPRSRASAVEQQQSQVKATTNADNRPRGFVHRGSINYKATTQQNNEIYTATSHSPKRFSTLVPKELYTPTTFKPSTYKQAYENNFYQTQQTVRPSSKPQKPSTFSTSPLPPTTANIYYNPDEDDGQYHPELYEADFPKNRFNLHRSSTTSTATRTNPTTTKTYPTTTKTTTTTRRPSSYTQQQQLQIHSPQSHLKTQQQTSLQKQQEQSEAVDLSDEEELFKTAHSLNFGAASINKLRADIYKAEKTSQQYNSQYSPQISAASPSSTSTTGSYTYVTHAATPASSTPSSVSTYFTTPITTPTTTTTRRPTSTTAIYTTTTTKKPKSHKKSSKGKKSTGKSASKRPPHADDDTSYDYAYYDTDTLSETPQDYPEYAIAEFSKTRRN